MTMQNKRSVLPALMLAIGLCACSGSETDADLTTTAPPGPQPIQPRLTRDLPFDRAYAITESPDGKIRLFTGETREGTDIYQITRLDDQTWSEPEKLDWPKVRSNTSPFFSPYDGRLYFASDRPLPDGAGRTDMNIWSVDLTADGWTDAQPIPGDVNTSFDETDVTQAADGTLYFVSKHPRGQGGQDIYSAHLDTNRGQWLLDTLPESLNSPLVESHVAISPDGNTLLWYSRLKPILGTVDIKAAQREEDGSWVGPFSLGPLINTQGIDFGASFSANGETFFFSRDGQLMSWPMADLIAEVERARRAYEAGRERAYLGLPEN